MISLQGNFATNHFARKQSFPYDEKFAFAIRCGAYLLATFVRTNFSLP